MHDDLAPAQIAMNKLLQCFFPEVADKLHALKNKLIDSDPLVASAFTNIQSLYPSSTAHSQQLTGPHRDEGNPRYGVEGLLVLGNFLQGGDFWVNGLNLGLGALPGSMFLFRANPFIHEIKGDWEYDKWRVSIAHYVKGALFGEHLGEAMPRLPGKKLPDWDMLDDMTQWTAGNHEISESLQSDYRGPVPNGTKFVGPEIELDTYDGSTFNDLDNLLV